MIQGTRCPSAKANRNRARQRRLNLEMMRSAALWKPPEDMKLSMISTLTGKKRIGNKLKIVEKRKDEVFGQWKNTTAS